MPVTDVPKGPGPAARPVRAVSVNLGRRVPGGGEGGLTPRCMRLRVQAVERDGAACARLRGLVRQGVALADTEAALRPVPLGVQTPQGPPQLAGSRLWFLQSNVMPVESGHPPAWGSAQGRWLLPPRCPERGGGLGSCFAGEAACEPVPGFQTLSVEVEGAARGARTVTGRRLGRKLSIA